MVLCAVKVDLYVDEDVRAGSNNVPFIWNRSVDVGSGEHMQYRRTAYEKGCALRAMHHY